MFCWTCWTVGRLSNIVAPCGFRTPQVIEYNIILYSKVLVRGLWADFAKTALLDRIQMLDGPTVQQVIHSPLWRTIPANPGQADA